MKAKFTLKELREPIKNVVCLKCGSKKCVIYPYPEPVGTLYCPKCSPTWLKEWLEWHAKKDKED